MKTILEDTDYYLDPETLPELNGIIAMFQNADANEFVAKLKLDCFGYYDGSNDMIYTSRLLITPIFEEEKIEVSEEIESTEQIEGEKKNEST